MTNMEMIRKFEDVIHYQFNDKKILRQALTHSSFSNEKRLDKLANNERLEFLGDAVLELVTSEYIYKKNSNMLEGDLTKLRASIVCEQTLSFCAREINLGDYILLGKGEAATGGRERNSILSDALEAVIGGIYLDGGFTNAKEFITNYILSDIDNKKLFFDSKTILQEIIQSRFKEPLRYELISEEGPDHNKKFTVVAFIGEKELGTGIGRTKKAAEQEAAYQSILKLRSQNIS
ncbi:ribonuclease 3 [Anaeromicropila herbilytica]|uniref:Ribonuclease 3 n=2 Tax=Anaeromicropila herbilytica TaxID=2785025 RepID=A0A7R7IDX8_9FIRM|nr:ribonuclease 3 [Anaeromicropila herbilytica]